jgi:hypothetical protein
VIVEAGDPLEAAAERVGGKVVDLADVSMTSAARQSRHGSNDV